MTLVAVTQWVRTERGKSPLTNAEPAGQECTPRAPPRNGHTKLEGTRPQAA